MIECKDCLAEGVTRPRKPATDRQGRPVPGKRCVTHWRALRLERKHRAHANHVETTYGLTAEEYKAIHKAQGGRCYMCRRATGARKALAVDHDHNKGCGHERNTGCRNCVRGLLCSTCNDIFGHARDDVGFFLRGIVYLKHPPAQVVLLGMD